MAFQLAPRTSSVCSQSPYSNFQYLSGFAPAVQFCQAFEVDYKVPSISNCPSGNSLCKILSSLSSCEIDVIAQGCICIGVTPTTTVSVPKSTTSPGKTTSQSSPAKSSATTSPKTTNTWTAVQSSSSTWATSTQATNTCPASTVTVTNTPTICSASTVTVKLTPTVCLPPKITPSTTSAVQCTSTPTCVDGAQPVCPPPAGAICQQNGTLSPTDWELITDGSAPSVSGCAAQCLADDGCMVSEYDYATQDCQLFNAGDAQQLGFVAVPDSPFIDSDVGCFELC
ncbi:hypothetical protein BDR22DRAFT_888800 [Usnea florida]